MTGQAINVTGDVTMEIERKGEINLNNKWGRSLLAAATLLTVLAGCGSTADSATGSSTEEAASSESKTITIGSQSSDAQIWEFIADSEAAEKAGLTLEVKDI